MVGQRPLKPLTMVRIHPPEPIFMNSQNKQLVDYLRAEGVLKTPELISAFYAIDRLDFVPPRYQSNAYGDFPVDIGFGQTISQPTTVAFMLELLRPEQGQIILDIGSGSGYTTALLTAIVGEEGQVVGIEKISELVALGEENLRRYNFKNARIVQAGPSLGMPEKKFDRILVSAAADKMPSELAKQLKNNGRMVVPVQNSIWLIEKNKSGKIRTEEHYGFVFVPLI